MKRGAAPAFVQMFNWGMRYPRRVVGSFLAVCLLAALGLEFRIGHSWTDWVDAADPAYASHARLAETFGDPDTLMMVFSRSALEGEARAGYFELIDALRAAEGVVQVFEPAELLLGADPETPPDSAAVTALVERLARGPQDFRAVLVSRDASLLAPLVLLEAGRPDLQGVILERVREGFHRLGIPVELAGTAVFSATLRSAIAQDLSRVCALLGITAAGMLLWVFRDIRTVAAVFGTLGISVMLAFALTALAGLAISLLSLILVPLVFCFCLTSAIHFLSRTAPDGSWCVKDAGPRVLPPLLLATLTSAAGCLVFANAPQAIVMRMGFVMAGAVLVSFLTTVLLLPAMLALLGRTARPPGHGPRLRRPGARLRRRLGSAVLMFAALCALALPTLRQDPDAFNFFPADAPLVRAWHHVEDAIGGLLVVDVLLEAAPGVRLDTPDARTKIAAFVTQVRQFPETTTVISGLELISGPGGMLALPPGLGEAFVREDRGAIRLSLRLRNTEGRPWQTLAQALHASGEDLRAAGIGVTVTGVIPLILEAQTRLLHVQALTLVAGLALTCVCAALVLQRWRLVLALIIAVFLPLLLAGGTMALCAIPLNAINVFVGSVILGLVVDDALYLLYACREGRSFATAAAEVDDALGVTSLTLGLAFGTLMLTSLVPLRQFGFIAGITIAGAWATHIGVLPWLLRGGPTSSNERSNA